MMKVSFRAFAPNHAAVAYDDGTSMAGCGGTDRLEAADKTSMPK